MKKTTRTTPIGTTMAIIVTVEPFFSPAQSLAVIKYHSLSNPLILCFVFLLFFFFNFNKQRPTNLRRSQQINKTLLPDGGTLVEAVVEL